MAASNVNLFEVGDAAVAGRDGDVFELDVHVVFCFDQLAAVGLARGYFEGYYVALFIFLGKSFSNRNISSCSVDCVA